MSNYQRWKNIMKAYPFDESRLAKWTPPYIVQPKYDGVRCRAVPLPNGEYLLLSSEENIFYSVPHINEMFKQLTKEGIISPNTEFDGELYRHGLTFEEISSITSRTTNIHKGYRDIRFYCFDIVNKELQLSRQVAVGKLRDVFPLLQIAPFWLCNNLEEILAVYDELVSHNYEGIIVRHYQGAYERKRSIWIMKFKPKQEDEYEIVGVQEEISLLGIPKGSLGALICKSGDGNLFNVGSGFTESTRRHLWEDRGRLPGMIAKVKYQHITPGRKVPRFPVFVEIV